MHSTSEFSPFSPAASKPFQTIMPKISGLFQDQQFPLNEFFQQSMSWEELLAIQSAQLKVQASHQEEATDLEWQASWAQVYKDYLMWRRDQFDDQEYGAFLLAAGRQWGDQPELLADLFFDSYFQLFIVKNFYLTEIDPQEPLDLGHDQYFLSEDGYYLFEYQDHDVDDDVVKIIKLILRSANSRQGVETVQTAIAQMQYSSFEMLQEEFYGQAAERLRSMGGMVYEDSLPWMSKVFLNDQQVETLLDGHKDTTTEKNSTALELQPKEWIRQWLTQSHHRWSFEQYYIRSVQALMVGAQQKQDLREWQQKVEFQLNRLMQLGEQLWARAIDLGVMLGPMAVNSNPEQTDPVQFAYRLGRSFHTRQLKRLEAVAEKFEPFFSPYQQSLKEHEPPMHLSIGEVITQLLNEIRGLSSSACSGRFDICTLNGQRFMAQLSKELSSVVALVESMDQSYLVTWHSSFSSASNQQSLLFNLETILLSDFMLWQLPKDQHAVQGQFGLNFQQLILLSEQYFSKSTAEQYLTLSSYWQYLLKREEPLTALCWWLSEMINVHLQGLQLRELSLEDRKYISGIIIHD